MMGAGRPIWDDLASDEDLAALAPPAPDRLPSKPDVLVVGGGVIGLAIAASCTRAGMEVVLVERERRLASGPSGRAAGGLGPDVHPDLGPRWHALAKHSLDLHAELDDEWDVGFRRCDVCVRPDLRIPGQGHVNPLALCAAFARRAGVIVTGVDAQELDVQAGHIVFATGDAPPNANVASQAFVKGHLIATEPAPFSVDGIVGEVEHDLLFLQLPSGHLVGGGTKEPGVQGADVDDDVVAMIATVMAGVWPQAATLRITHRWTCFRPHVPGYLPVVRRIGDDAWVAASFFSTGILMAPAIGEFIAEAIAGRTQDDGLEFEI